MHAIPGCISDSILRDHPTDSSSLFSVPSGHSLWSGLQKQKGNLKTLPAVYSYSEASCFVSKPTRYQLPQPVETLPSVPAPMLAPAKSIYGGRGLIHITDFRRHRYLSEVLLPKLSAYISAVQLTASKTPCYLPCLCPSTDNATRRPCACSLDLLDGESSRLFYLVRATKLLHTPGA
jgi:hypothetical protein